MQDDLIIVNNTHLEYIIIKNNTLKNLNSLVINNNPNLLRIIVEDGIIIDEESSIGSLENVKSVSLISIL